MLISVIIPAYNAAPTLERSVNSILNQTFKDFEIIIINDGSKDDTPEICDRLSKNNDNIRVFHQKNQGISAVRNKGIKLAQAEFIAFLDADDEYSDNLFKDFKEAYDKTQLDLYIFNYLRIKENKTERRNSVNLVTSNNEEALKTVFEKNGVDFYVWNKIAKKHLYDNVIFPKGKIYEDMFPVYQLVNNASKIVIDEGEKLLYYASDDSLTAKKFNDRQFDNVTERIRLLNEIKKNYPKITDLAAKRLFDGLLDVGYRLANHDNIEEIEKYEKELKNTYIKYRNDFKKNPSISSIKKIAWKMYIFSPKLYKTIYDFYLN